MKNLHLRKFDAIKSRSNLIAINMKTVLLELTLVPISRQKQIFHSVDKQFFHSVSAT